MKYKICVYAISKNEEKFVDRFMNSVSEADLVIVTDTGSSDKTVEKLRQRGAKVYEENIVPWRFDTARNISLNHVPEDTDICICVDLDEVLSCGWRKKLEDSWKPSCTHARYLFTSDFNEDGTPSKQFIKEKIHRRKNFKWVNPVHEVLRYDGTDKKEEVFIKGLVVNHYPDLTKSRIQYMPLLELAAKENPEDDRTVFWLGREYLYHKKYELCIETLKRHLSLKTANWAEERSASMRFIGSAYEGLGNTKEAKSWLFRAIAECPTVREPYLKMAQLGYSESNWTLVYAMVKNGLDIRESTGSYLVEPKSWGFAFYDLGAISAYYLGLYEESLNFAMKALEFDICNERLKENLELIKNKVKETHSSDTDKKDGGKEDGQL